MSAFLKHHEIRMMNPRMLLHLGFVPFCWRNWHAVVSYENEQISQTKFSLRPFHDVQMSAMHPVVVDDVLTFDYKNALIGQYPMSLRNCLRIVRFQLIVFPVTTESFCHDRIVFSTLIDISQERWIEHD